MSHYTALRRHLLIAPAIALFGFTACVQFKAHPISSAGKAADYAGRSLGDPGLQRFLVEQKAAHAPWDVNRVALAAAYFHPDVALARSLAAEAAAGIQTAGQRPNPVFTFAPAYSPSLGQGIYPYNLSPTLNVIFETAGKRAKRLAQAHAETEAAQLRVSSAAWTARTNVRTAMLALYAARQNTALLQQEAALNEEALTKLKFQVEEGEAPALDLTVARLALNRAKLALHDVERQAATAFEQLAGAVGVPTSALNAVKLDFSAFEALPSVPADTLRRRALTHRADLLALLTDYAVSEAMLRVEIANQYPNVQLNPTDQLDHSGNRWGIGITMALPILHRNGGQIAQAEARRKSAEARFDSRQSAVIMETGSAYAAYKTCLAKVATAEKLAAEAAHTSDTTKKMVDVGELVPLDLVRRRIEASASNLALLTARIEAQAAAGLLETTLQTPLR
jgi:outer membrane protein, heavy metal efflux system